MSTDPSRIRLLVVDDDGTYRELLVAFLGLCAELEVVGSAASGEEAVLASAELSPAVVLMDVQMPGIGGVGATRAITEAQPDVHVLAHTVMADLETVVAMLRAGAVGYLLKGASPTGLSQHIRAVAEGGGALAPAVARALVNDVRTRPDRNPPTAVDLPAPTAGELEVLRHLAEGLSNAQIAREIGLSHGTVKARIGALMQKWRATGRAQVVVLAIKAGYI